MANDFSPLEFLTAPEDAQASAMQAARRRALQARLPGAMALALGPTAGGAAAGRELLGQEVPENRQADALAEARLLAQHRQVQEKQGWAQLEQGRWVPVVKTDPSTGETIAIMVDSRTGRVRSLTPHPPQMMPSHTPGGLPPMPMGLKLSEQQEKLAGATGGTVDAMRNALAVGFPNAGLRGTGQAFGQEMVRRGFPGLASASAQQTYGSWYNVIRPLVNIRTGQQMAVEELIREMNALAPRPGDDDRTQLMKVHLMVPMMRRYLVGLPRPLAARLNAEYDQVERLLPQSVEDLRRMKASGTPGQYEGQGAPQPPQQQQPQQGPVGTINGRPVGYR